MSSNVLSLVTKLPCSRHAVFSHLNGHVNEIFYKKLGVLRVIRFMFGLPRCSRYFNPPFKTAFDACGMNHYQDTRHVMGLMAYDKRKQQTKGSRHAINEVIFLLSGSKEACSCNKH